jgi:Trichohyalin-plectin-homology domain
MSKRIKTRLELLDAYHDQIQEKRLRVQTQLDTDAEFKQKMLEKYAMEDKLDQMATQKARMRQLAHRHTVESMIARRVAEREMGVRREKELYARERELEAYKDAIVEQERRRLLVKHAEGLVGFMPRVCTS